MEIKIEGHKYDDLDHAAACYGASDANHLMPYLTTGMIRASREEMIVIEKAYKAYREISNCSRMQDPWSNTVEFEDK